MPKISIFKRKDNNQPQYSIILPKDIMDSLSVQKGDELLFIGEMGGEIRFRLKRSE